ncbi:MAG: AraC family transcriptional regulator, partial [Proteobacteria bacterium]
MGPSTLTSWALLIHRALSAHGIDGDAMFRRAVLDPAQMRDPNARYPMAAMQRLWSLATAATNECFGLDVAKEWHPTTFHALGYSALASETLREALSRSARYSRVVTTGARLELHDLGSEVMVSARSSIPEEKVVPASLDAGLASLLIMCR